jgi:hypothetical protein
MKAHQHGSALKIRMIVPRWADKTEDRDKLKVNDGDDGGDGRCRAGLL